MVKPQTQGQNVRNEGSLTINDKFLHYIYVHILSP